ncbi:MAG TPA: helix-turn-helix domain-containing protein [Myxococcota bacterium]|nr:helix-turn-helix domain-containing protein [Myxococcota bacterium]
MPAHIRADDPRPEQLAEGDFHQGTWQVMAVLVQLMACKGWLGSSKLGEVAGLNRDSVRRICRTLESQGWVRRESHDGQDLWTIGPELPRIGVQYHELINRRLTALDADFNRLKERF